MELRNAVQACFERMQNSACARSGGAADPSFLRALHIVYEQLEQQLTRAGASLAHVSQRRKQLEHELLTAHVDLRAVDRPALHALVLAQSIRRDAAEAPALIGYAQVLELAWQLTRGPVPRRFEPQLEAAALPAAISGAEGLCLLLELFEGQPPDRNESVRFLNLDAGKHPIPRDLREVEAAVRAGEQSYRDWQYYHARFGERGLRFTRSDSAWIAYVARRDEQSVQNNLDWLSRLLASRGMPRLLFEQHLQHLHAQLIHAVPEHAAEYHSLLRAAARLQAARATLLPDIEPLARKFQPPAASRPLPLTAAEAGRLLVAATVDAQLGVVNAVASLTSWLGDAVRFGEDWSSAVTRFLQQARDTF